MSCEVCNRQDVESVGVAAIPGAPMSVSWCRECLLNDAQPMFVVESNICPCDPEGDPYYDESLEHGIEYAKMRGFKPWEHLANWFLTCTVWNGESYVPIGEHLRQLWDTVEVTDRKEQSDAQ